MAGVPDGDAIAAGAPQGGDITVRYGGRVAPHSQSGADVAAAPKGDAIHAVQGV